MSAPIQLLDRQGQCHPAAGLANLRVSGCPAPELLSDRTSREHKAACGDMVRGKWRKRLEGQGEDILR